MPLNRPEGQQSSPPIQNPFVVGKEYGLTLWKKDLAKVCLYPKNYIWKRYLNQKLKYMSILKYMYLCIISIYSVLQKLEDDFCKISYLSNFLKWWMVFLLKLYISISK